jgi:hypothetical protein
MEENRKSKPNLEELDEADIPSDFLFGNDRDRRPYEERPECAAAECSKDTLFENVQRNLLLSFPIYQLMLPAAGL